MENIERKSKSIGSSKYVSDKDNKVDRYYDMISWRDGKIDIEHMSNPNNRCAFVFSKDTATVTMYVYANLDDMLEEMGLIQESIEGANVADTTVCYISQ